MNNEIRWYAPRAQAEGANGILRRTGWSLLDDSDAGYGIGAVLKVGAGGITMTLQNANSGLTFGLNAGYVEGGVGIGLDIEAEGPGKAALEFASGVSTDGGMMPGGSLGEFVFGPYARKGRVDTPDFCKAIMIYAHLSGTLGMAGGDVGIMFLMDFEVTAASAWTLIRDFADGGVVGGAANTFLRNVLCWQFCYGLGFGLGVEAGAAVRVLLTGELTIAGGLKSIASAEEPFRIYPGVY
jgi:hypothetical protein